MVSTTVADQDAVAGALGAERLWVAVGWNDRPSPTIEVKAASRS